MINIKWTFVISLSLSASAVLGGCVAHLRAPEPDLRDLTPVRPAAQVSSIAAVARIPYATLGKLIEHELPPRASGTERLGMVDATWQVWRDGAIGARPDERGRLCFDAPFAGKGAMAAFGQRLERELRASLHLCAVPYLDQAAVLRLRDVDARVLVDRNALGGPLQSLLDAVAERLQRVGSAETTDRIRHLSIPMLDAMAPVQTAIARPMDVGQQGCLKLRPQEARLAQPGIDPSALRIAAAVDALPTVERPCAQEAGPRPGSGRIATTVVDNLLQPKTSLWLPVSTALELLQPEVQRAVDAMGVIRSAQGWLKVGKVQLATSRGHLLARAQVDGEVQDRVLFIPVKRTVKGEVVLWGVPTVTARGVELADLQLDVQSEDALVDLAAGLRRSELSRIVAGKLMITKEKIDGDARRALAAMAQTVDIGSQQLPVRVEIEQLGLEQVTAAGQRIEVLVRFVGQVVVGDTGQR